MSDANAMLQPEHCWIQWLVQLSDLPSFLYASQKSIRTVQTAEQVSKIINPLKDSVMSVLRLRPT